MAKTMNPNELTDMQLVTKLETAIKWHQTEELGEGRLIPYDPETTALIEEQRRRREGKLALGATITIVT